MGTMQRAAIGPSLVNEIPPIVHEVLRSPGRPLDENTRAFLEPRFGHDFSQVRVHTDAKATESARAVHALAYTVGQDVVFGAGQYVPHTREGQRLIAHELTHTIQQAAFAPTAIAVQAPITIASEESTLERTAEKNANHLTNNLKVPALSPSIALQRAPADESEIQSYVFAGDKRLSTDKNFAHRSGQEIAARIRKIGAVSRDIRLELNGMLAFFQGEAKEVYIHEIKPALVAVTEIEMPEEQIEKKVPSLRPKTLSLVPRDPRQVSEKQIYAGLIEAGEKEAAELEQERFIKMETLREKTKGWGDDQVFALELLEPILKANLNADPRGVSDAIRKPILARYETWLRAVDKRREELCQKMQGVGGLMGVRLKIEAKANPTLDPCIPWFEGENDFRGEYYSVPFEYRHGPSELAHLERLLNIFRGSGKNATAQVYYDVLEYRKLTDPLMLQLEQMAGEMLGGVAAAIGAPRVKATATMPAVTPQKRPIGSQPPTAAPPMPAQPKAPKPPPATPTITRSEPQQTIPTAPTIVTPKTGFLKRTPAKVLSSVLQGTDLPDVFPGIGAGGMTGGRPVPALVQPSSPVKPATPPTIRPSVVAPAPVTPAPPVAPVRPAPPAPVTPTPPTATGGTVVKPAPPVAPVRRVIPPAVVAVPTEPPKAPKVEPLVGSKVDAKARAKAKVEAAKASKLSQIEEAKETKLQIYSEIEELTQQGKQRLTDAQREKLKRDKADLALEAKAQIALENKLRAQYDDLQITQYERARAYSYSDAAARDVVKRAGGLDEMSGKKLLEPSIDHVVSIEEMATYEGFDDLVNTDLYEVISRKDNLRLMEKGPNSSKGGKRWEDWKAGRRLYGEAVWQQMVEVERNLRSEIRKDIKARAAKRKRSTQ